MKPVVFIQSSDHAFIPATVAAHSLRSCSKHADEFDVRIMHMEKIPHIARRFNQRYFWAENQETTLLQRDSQAFSCLRMMVPQLMEYSGRALVIDPDIFAIGDVFELLTRDMKGKAIVCCKRPRKDLAQPVRYASSVMLLDCEQLKHWQWNQQIDDIFAGKLMMDSWLSLWYEQEDNIGPLEQIWNHFETIDEDTKLVHYTERGTHPWKTGLIRDDAQYAQRQPYSLKKRLKRLLFKSQHPHAVERFVAHPNTKLEEYFFQVLSNCLRDRVITENQLRQEIRAKHIRADIFARLQRHSESSCLSAKYSSTNF